MGRSFSRRARWAFVLIAAVACGEPRSASSPNDAGIGPPGPSEGDASASTPDGSDDDGGCKPTVANGENSSGAGYGCGDGGTPGFCDNGVRQQPPTCNETVDALVKRTPLVCASKNSTHSYKLDSDPADKDSVAGLTADMCNLQGAIYWVADMDIDCDGKRTAECPGSGANADPSWQDNTSVQSNGGPLTAAKNLYVVIPSDNAKGVSPGAVVAVIHGTKVVYAIYGDLGPKDIIGEGSYALAKALGIPPSPANGGALGRTVTYIAFTGKDAVPNDLDDQSEIDALGKTLTEKFLQNNP